MPERVLYAACSALGFLVYLYLCYRSSVRGRNKLVDDIEAFVDIILRVGRKITSPPGRDVQACAFTVGVAAITGPILLVWGVSLLWTPHAASRAIWLVILLLSAVLLWFVLVHLCNWVNQLIVRGGLG